MQGAEHIVSSNVKALQLFAGHGLQWVVACRRDVGKQNIVLQLQRQEERALIEALNRLPGD